MRTQAIFGFRSNGGCDLIVRPSDKVEDAIKAAADMATTKDIGEFIRVEVWDSEKGRIRSIFGITPPPKSQPKPESKMKKVISVIVTAMLLLACNASAQYMSFSLGTNGVAVHPSTSNDVEVASVADLKNNAGLSIQVSAENDSASAVDLGLYFTSSPDGVTYTAASAAVGVLLPLTATAGTTSVFVTNILNGYHTNRYWKLAWPTNASETPIVTNVAVKYSAVPSRNIPLRWRSIPLGTNGHALYRSTANDIETTTILDLAESHGLWLRVNGTNGQSAAAGLGIYFVRSVDGVTYENKAVNGVIVPFVATANAQTHFITNIVSDISYPRYWKISYITNSAAAADLSKIDIKYATSAAK